MLIGLGNTFTVYLNGQNSGVFQEGSIAEGQIGLLAGTGTNSQKSNCTFVNSTLWKIDHPPQPEHIGTNVPVIPIQYGDTQPGSIQDTTFAVYFTFNGQAGDVITIAMNRTAGDLDALVALRDPNGNMIGVSDDIAGENTRDAQLESITLPANGTYTIIATRFQQDIGLTKGDFTVTLEHVN